MESIVQYFPQKNNVAILPPIHVMRYDEVMIAHLRGTITAIHRDSIVLDVGGVGYRLHLAKDVLATMHKAQKEQKISLFTHLAVRENALDLFGFLTEEELEFFEMLISISGIGPKSALAILNIADIATLKAAISAGDSTYLTKVSGIGKKSAQKIILELQEEIGVLDGNAHEAISGDADTFEALKSLGYSTNEARDAIKQVSKDILGPNNRLKEALKLLGK